MPEVNEIVIRSDYRAQFVDREPAKKIFEEKLNSQTNKSYEVIYISGMPGVGKSRLAEELKNIALARGHSKNYLELDFYRNIRESFEYLEWMAEELHKKSGVVFPLFSYALIIFYIKWNVENRKDEENIKALSHKHKFIYDYLDNAFDISGLIPTAGAYSSAVGSSITKFLSFAEDKIRNKYQRKKLPENYVEILNSSSEIIEKNLSLFWAIDMKVASEASNIPFIFFLDTYEAYMSDLNSDDNQKKRDYWLFDNSKGIIRVVPNALWIITGRDSLYENDDTICKVTLDCLPKEWQTIMLNDAHIPFSIAEHIKKVSEGLPLHIELCIDTYIELVSQGKTPLEEDFEGTYEDLLTRYIRYMNDKKEILDVVYFLACLGKWNENSFLNEVHDCDIAISLSAYETVRKLSFIIKSQEGDYEIHSVARKIFMRNCPEIIKRAFDNHISTMKSNNMLSLQEEYAIFSEKVDEDFTKKYDGKYRQMIAVFDKNRGYLQELLSTRQFEKFGRLLSQFTKNIRINEIVDNVSSDKDLCSEYIDFLRMGVVYYEHTEQDSKAADFQQIVIDLLASNEENDSKEIIIEKYKLASFLFVTRGSQSLNKMCEIAKECFDLLGEDDEITIKVINLFMIKSGEAELKDVVDFVNNQRLLHGDNSPRGIKVGINLALAYKKAGDIEKAIHIGKDTCKKMGMYLSEKDTDCINARHNLVLAYMALAEKQSNSPIKYDRKQAPKTLRIAKEINVKICNIIESEDVCLRESKFDYYYSLVKCFVLLKEFKGAQNYCERMIEISKKEPQPASALHMVYDTMATIMLKDGEIDRAIYFMEKLVLIDEEIWGKGCIQAEEIRRNIIIHKMMNNKK